MENQYKDTGSYEFNQRILQRQAQVAIAASALQKKKAENRDKIMRAKRMTALIADRPAFADLLGMQSENHYVQKTADNKTEEAH